MWGRVDLWEDQEVQWTIIWAPVWIRVQEVAVQWEEEAWVETRGEAEEEIWEGAVLLLAEEEETLAGEETLWEEEVEIWEEEVATWEEEALST